MGDKPLTDADIRGFWSWFASHAEEIKKSHESLAREIGQRIRAVDPDLGWELGSPDGHNWELAIRSEDCAQRSTAFRVVEASPSLPGWVVSPFRAPGSTAGVLTWEDGAKWELSEFTAALSPAADGPFLELILSHPKFQKVPEKARLGPGFTALDTALGEELAEEGIDGVDFLSGAARSIPLRSLRDEVKSRLAKLRAAAGAKSDRWVLAEQRERGELPVILTIPESLDMRRIGHMPWLVEASTRVEEPNENGMPEGEEYSRLRNLDEPLGAALRRDRPVVFWGTETGRGRRTFRFYAPGPVTGLEETVNAALLECDVQGDVTVLHDPRWRAFRDRRPRV